MAQPRSTSNSGMCFWRSGRSRDRATQFFPSESDCLFATANGEGSPISTPCSISSKRLIRGDGELLLILLVGSFVVGDAEVGRTAFEVPDACAGFFDQVLIVCDEEDGAFVLLDGLVERVDAFKVQVVRRFV